MLESHHTPLQKKNHAKTNRQLYMGMVSGGGCLGLALVIRMPQHKVLGGGHLYGGQAWSVEMAALTQ